MHTKWSNYGFSTVLLRHRGDVLCHRGAEVLHTAPHIQGYRVLQNLAKIYDARILQNLVEAGVEWLPSHFYYQV